MGTLDMDSMNKMFLGKDEADTLAKFAAEDGCFKIYKFKGRSDGPYNHYMPIRHERDEAAMFSSQWVFDPVLVWPLKSRKIPLLGDFRTITAEADTSEAALELAKRKIPEGYAVFVSDRTEPEKEILKTLMFQAETLEEARAQAQKEIVEGMVILDERQINIAGSELKCEGHGWTDQEAEQMANDLVKKNPAFVKIVNTKNTVPAKQTLLQVSAKNEQDARKDPAVIKKVKSEGWTIRGEARLVKTAPAILSSLGIMKNLYEFTLAKEGYVEVWYQSKAQIELRYGRRGKATVNLTVGREVC